MMKYFFLGCLVSSGFTAIDLLMISYIFRCLLKRKMVDGFDLYKRWVIEQLTEEDES